MIKNAILFILLSASIMVAQHSEEKTDIELQNFTLENLESDYIEFYPLIGKGPIVISFWATWCKPCKEELKQLNKIYNEYSDSGLVMLAISVDNEKSISKVEPYIKSNGFDFEVLLDTNSEVARIFYAQTVPHTVIIDKTGEVVYVHSGYKKGDELNVKAMVEKLL